MNTEMTNHNLLFNLADSTDEEFKLAMVEMIKANFANLLDEEDLKLLDGSEEGLEQIAEKFHNKFDQSSNKKVH